MAHTVDVSQHLGLSHHQVQLDLEMARFGLHLHHCAQFVELLHNVFGAHHWLELLLVQKGSVQHLVHLKREHVAGVHDQFGVLLVALKSVAANDPLCKHGHAAQRGQHFVAHVRGKQVEQLDFHAGAVELVLLRFVVDADHRAVLALKGHFLGSHKENQLCFGLTFFISDLIHAVIRQLISARDLAVLVATDRQNQLAVFLFSSHKHSTRVVLGKFQQRVILALGKLAIRQFSRRFICLFCLKVGRTQHRVQTGSLFFAGRD